MQCPKCRFEIVHGTALECPRCGVIFAKISAALPQSDRATQFALPISESKPRSSARFLIIGLVAVVAGIFALNKLRDGAADSAPQGWYSGAGGYARGIAEQRSSNQPVLLYFYTDWCGWCRKLERDVFSSAEFQQRYPSMIKVKVNPESGSSERRLGKTYKIRGYPTIFLIKNGVEAQSIVGYLDRPDFFAALDR